MPNNPWNWHDWHWPLGGRHAIEIFRNRTEMPFTLSLEDNSSGNLGECTFTLQYLQNHHPPRVTVIWGPSAAYLMNLINSPWPILRESIMESELNAGEWKSLMCVESGENWQQTAEYFVLERAQVNLVLENDELPATSLSSILSGTYCTAKFKLIPPVDFDWGLLQNQFRYPAAVFITPSSSSAFDEEYSIVIKIHHLPVKSECILLLNCSVILILQAGLMQIVHLKNHTFPNTSTTLAQYIKMSTGHVHILQSLYVMDEHLREDDSDQEFDGDTDVPISQPPFKDILCSVCQCSPVSRVIIPCRHVCLCTQCFEKVENCPICRGPILYYFKTRQDLQPDWPSDGGASNENLTWWQKIERFNDRFSDAMGLIRQH